MDAIQIKNNFQLWYEDFFFLFYVTVLLKLFLFPIGFVKLQLANLRSLNENSAVVCLCREKLGIVTVIL
jgi:hypothetical protein